jgi:hypothetical protein
MELYAMRFDERIVDGGRLGISIRVRPVIIQSGHVMAVIMKTTSVLTKVFASVYPTLVCGMVSDSSLVEPFFDVIMLSFIVLNCIPVGQYDM